MVHSTLLGTWYLDVSDILFYVLSCLLHGYLDIYNMVTWVPLPQVKPVELTDFLQLKKSEGYCIVGVEQTANSQSLQDYQFPEKTLLLLGYVFTKNHCWPQKHRGAPEFSP